MRWGYDNAACRIGKGTHFAMDRLTKFMREYYKKYGSEGYILKCDIRKYFDSIYQPVLKDKISKMIANDQIDYTNLHNSLVSTRGHLLYGNTYHLRTRYFNELDNIIYTHDMEKADMWTTYLIETNNKPIQEEEHNGNYEKKQR